MDERRRNMASAVCDHPLIGRREEIVISVVVVGPAGAGATRRVDLSSNSPAIAPAAHFGSSPGPRRTSGCNDCRGEIGNDRLASVLSNPGGDVVGTESKMAAEPVGREAIAVTAARPPIHE